MNNYSYRETIDPDTGDKLWLVEDISLASGGITELIEKFIEEFNFPEYSLSIYDNITRNTVEIDCNIDNISKIVDYVYHCEKGTPLTFVGLNSLSESYVVGMSFCRGRIDFGVYKDKNGLIEKI